MIIYSNTNNSNVKICVKKFAKSNLLPVIIKMLQICNNTGTPNTQARRNAT